MRMLAILGLFLAFPALAGGAELIPVAGLVLDAATARPIAGAIVTVKGHEAVTTDEKGEWKLAVPPTTRYRPHGVTVRATGRAPTQVWLRAPSYLKSVRAPTAWLGPVCAQIRGRVVRADGTAVAEARVELDMPRATGGLSWSLRIRADAKGRFGPVPATAGVVIISAYGIRAHRARVQRFVYPGRTVEETVELVAPAIEEVEGQVVDREGKPVSGATIGCRPEIDRETVTDEEGRFRWPVPVGGCCGIWFRKDGFASGIHRPFLLSALLRGPFVLEREAAKTPASEEEKPSETLVTIRLTVVDQQSRPVPGAGLRLRWHPFHPASYTDSAGRASLRIASDRAWQLVVSHPHYATHKGRFEVPESGEVALDPVVLKRAKIEFDAVIVDEKGRGLPSACVILLNRDNIDGRDARIIPTDTNGRIRSPSLHRTLLKAPGRVFRYGPPAPPAGGKFVLAKSRPLSGVVVNAAGVPLYGVLVELRSGRRTWTDGLGRFRIEGLPQGEPVRLTAWESPSARGPVLSTEVSATPGQAKLRIVLREK